MKFIQNPEYVELIPRLTTKEYERLKKSIKDFGLQYPIIVNQDNPPVILDGHHRLQACNELGITPAFTMKDFSGKPIDELKFIVTVNINRRQLNEFQKAQVAIRFKKLHAERESSKNRMRRAWYFTKNTGKQAAIRRWYGDTENLIEEYQSVFGS